MAFRITGNSASGDCTEKTAGSHHLGRGASGSLRLSHLASYDQLGGPRITSKQQGVIRGVIPAAVASLLGVCGVSQFTPVRALPVDDVAARVEWGLQWALLPILTVMISVMRVANHRFSAPDDIDGSGLTTGTDRVLLLRAILQNTLEQSVLAVTLMLRLLSWLAGSLNER